MQIVIDSSVPDHWWSSIILNMATIICGYFLSSMLISGWLSVPLQKYKVNDIFRKSKFGQILTWFG